MTISPAAERPDSDYQLIAETVYSNVEPASPKIPRPGDRSRSRLRLRRYRTEDFDNLIIR
jgi:hypothetical protein